MTTLLLALAVLLAPLKIDIYPRIQMTPNHADVRVRITAERDEANRVLGWAWESPNESGMSTRQLDGSDCPRVWTIWLKHLPPGEYIFIAWIGRNDGREIRQQDHFTIVGTE